MNQARSKNGPFSRNKDEKNDRKPRQSRYRGRNIVDQYPGEKLKKFEKEESNFGKRSFGGGGAMGREEDQRETPPRTPRLRNIEHLEFITPFSLII